jgi:hypothetical protein
VVLYMSHSLASLSLGVFSLMGSVKICTLRSAALQSGKFLRQIGFVECIRQCDAMYIFRITVCGDFGVHIERHGHQHGFAGLKHLFCETKTIDFGEKSARLVRGNIVGCCACNHAIGWVMRLVECATPFHVQQA